MVSGQLSVVSCQWSVVSGQPPRHREESSAKHREAAAQAHLAGFWEIIGHTAGREMGFAAVAPC